jgi:hypothetical protein
MDTRPVPSSLSTRTNTTFFESPANLDRFQRTAQFPSPSDTILKPHFILLIPLNYSLFHPQIVLKAITATHVLPTARRIIATTQALALTELMVWAIALVFQVISDHSARLSANPRSTVPGMGNAFRTGNASVSSVTHPPIVL